MSLLAATEHSQAAVRSKHSKRFFYFRQEIGEF
jgi:hypothetical protein